MPVWGQKATARVAILKANGDQLVVSDITRLECRTGPLISGDLKLLAQFDGFFALPDVRVLPITASVCDRAALNRARGYKLGDALNLATAVEAGCGLFLTNDSGLKGFPDITVEVLS